MARARLPRLSPAALVEAPSRPLSPRRRASSRAHASLRSVLSSFPSVLGCWRSAQALDRLGSDGFCARPRLDIGHLRRHMRRRLCCRRCRWRRRLEDDPPAHPQPLPILCQRRLWCQCLQLHPRRLHSQARRLQRSQRRRARHRRSARTNASASVQGSYASASW
eukprot:Amastigsp_a680766_39.p3 type:complete len:164 gc:universal Amastigsp_a680766_39:971-480(-)